jgi:ATP-dependent DNA helicase RecG
MVTTSEQIDLWKAAASEYQNLEFKAAQTGYDRGKTEAYCVAIANEGGGILLFGITDPKPRKVVGSQACRDVVGMASALFLSLGFRVDVEEVQHPDGRVIVFHIPSRPRGTAYHLDGKYLMRSGESLVPMSEDRLRTIFAEGRPDWLEETSAEKLSAQEVIGLLDTQTFFDLLKQPYPTDQAGVLEKLLRESLIDEHASGYTIRHICALLLAKRLEDFPEAARRAPRVLVYKGNSKLETRIDQTGGRGYAVGFRGLIDFIMAQLPQNEVIENALRKEVKLLPEDCIRELVANALVHQDFLVTGGSPMIEIYSNRVEISNPGEPIVPVARFIDGYQSRNERFADLMRRMHICEQKSSGVDRVIHTAEVFQLPAPEFIVGHKRTHAVVFGPRGFDEMDRDDRVRACYQHCALKRVLFERMTNQTLRERFGLPEGKAAVTSQIIAAAIEAGMIKADEAVGGSRKFARYLPFWA